MRRPPRLVTPFAVSLLLAAGACERGPAGRIEQERYVVSAAPIDIGLAPRFCVAVEPANAKGVWWWHPGPTGCATRSTGPSVFEAQDASVKSTSPNTSEVRFRVPLIRGVGSQQPDAIDVLMILEGGHLIVPATKARVATERRRALDIPERS